MRPVTTALCTLVLATVCLFATASDARAFDHRRHVAPPVIYHPSAPVYYGGARIGTGIYVYPQVSPVPSYYFWNPYFTMFPSGYPYSGSYYYGSYGNWAVTPYSLYPNYGYSYGYYFNFR
jgi:hypothetical protein